jgi:hypothetical protein
MTSSYQWSVALAGAGGQVAIKTISQSGVTMPASFTTGDSWSQETVFEMESDTLNGTGRLTYDFYAAGPETIAVPAGTFPTMKIDVRARLEDMAGQYPATLYEGSMWVCAGVGTVRRSGETSVEGLGNPILVTAELSSYNLP